MEVHMGFVVVRNGVSEKLDQQEFMLRYDFIMGYPKVEKINDHHFRVLLSETDYLEEVFQTYEDADAESYFIRRLAYNIHGIWRSGG
jgi:hypothetical protein